MNVYLSTSTNPYANLALEETLFSRVQKSGPLLLLYENSPAVVLGRCQNPWKECCTGLARQQGIPILRRISGGGTVVHGPGNLNWSIISPLKPDKKTNLERMIQALNRIGLKVNNNDRHDLYFEHPESQQHKKVSGTAFRQTAQGSIHHATLLVNADLKALGALLTLPHRDMDSKGVPSHPSSVGNLNELQQDLCMEKIISAIAMEWRQQQECKKLNVADYYNDGDYISSLERLRSEEWVWTKTPHFVERFANLPGFRNNILQCTVREGSIAEIDITGNTFDTLPESITQLVKNLPGKPYRGHVLLDSYSNPLPQWIQVLAARVEGLRIHGFRF